MTPAQNSIFSMQGVPGQRKMIVELVWGSHLFGTATSASDKDYLGVFLPTKEEVLCGRVPKSLRFRTQKDGLKNTPGDVDMECYSLHYFLDLARQGQTVALDMLHAGKDMVLFSSDTWESIVENRRRFYTKNLNAFIHYARQHAARYGIKGSRIMAVRQVIEVLESMDSEKKMRDAWGLLPKMEHCHELPPDPNGMRQYQVCGKIFQESASVGYVAPVLKKYLQTYGNRALSAATSGGIDWKSISHALRSAFQVREILLDNTITFPLKDAPFLLEVKQGNLDYETRVAPVLEALMAEVERLMEKSSLPEKVDGAFWDRFLCATLEREFFSLPRGMDGLP